MRLLVRPDPKLTDVRVHRAVRQRELHVPTRPTSATFFPFRQLEARQVRHKVRLPLMPPRLDRPKLALPAEIAIFTYPILERVLIFKNEPDVVEQIQNDRQVRYRRKAGRLAA